MNKHSHPHPHTHGHARAHLESDPAAAHDSADFRPHAHLRADRTAVGHAHEHEHHHDHERSHAHGHPRSRARRIALVVASVLAFYALIAGMALGFVGARAFRAKSQITAAQADLRTGNWKRGRFELTIAGRALHDARTPIVRAVLAPLAATPYVGDSVDAIDEMTSAADAVVVSTNGVLEAFGDVDPSTLKIQDGKLPDVPWGRVATAAEHAAGRVKAASNALRDRPGSGVPSRLRDARTKLQDQAAKAAHSFERLGLAAGAAECFFAKDSTIMVLLQNNSEMRATGGYPDQMVELSLRASKLKIESNHFDEGMDPATFARFRALLTGPNFPTEAAEVAAFVAKQWGIHPDVILSLDIAGVAGLFDVVGPITEDNFTVSGKNYVPFSTVDIYRRYPDRARRHLFEAAVTSQLLDRLFSGSVRFGSLGDAIGPLLAQKHMFFWSPESTIQSAFLRLAIADANEVQTGALTVGVFSNALDKRWSKLAPFVRRRIQVRAQADAAGNVTGTLTVSIVNESPDGLPPYILGPDRDETFRAHLEVLGGRANPVAFAVPQGRTEARSFPIAMKTASGDLIVRYLAQPLLQADELDIQITLAPGVTAFSLEGFRLGGQTLRFRGTSASDVQLRAHYR